MPKNSRNLTDLEGIALLERTGAWWEVSHWLHRRGQEPGERYYSARISIETGVDLGMILAQGYGPTLGRAALRCMIDMIRKMDEATKEASNAH